MKKMMMISCGLLMGAAAVMASPALTIDKGQDSAVLSQEKRVKIKAEDLPEAVKKTLEGDEYKGWMINAAFHHTDKDQYEVELKNGAETKTVKFDKDGKKVDN